jgi:hypothetical protein
VFVGCYQVAALTGELGVLFFKSTSFNRAFVASLDGVKDLWIFPACAFGGRFLYRQCGQKSMVCDFPITPIAQSPNWPACKELSAKEGKAVFVLHILSGS